MTRATSRLRQRLGPWKDADISHPQLRTVPWGPDGHHDLGRGRHRVGAVGHVRIVGDNLDRRPSGCCRGGGVHHRAKCPAPSLRGSRFRHDVHLPRLSPRRSRRRWRAGRGGAVERQRRGCVCCCQVSPSWSASTSSASEGSFMPASTGWGRHPPGRRRGGGRRVGGRRPGWGRSHVRPRCRGEPVGRGRVEAESGRRVNSVRHPARSCRGMSVRRRRTVRGGR